MLSKLLKHHNLILITILALTLSVCSLFNQRQKLNAVSTVALPVVQTTTSPGSAIDAYKESRDSAARQDMAALEALVNQQDLDPQTRADAAAALQRIVDRREKQLALEGALLQSGIFPCAAVVEEGSVTIVTEKTALTDGETALVLTMAQVHAGALPSGVRVITADASEK